MTSATTTPRHELRRARRLAGLTLKALAGRLGVSLAAVSAWECGTRRPGDAQLKPLARALRLTPARVLDLIDHPRAGAATPA